MLIDSPSLIQIPQSNTVSEPEHGQGRPQSTVRRLERGYERLLVRIAQGVTNIDGNRSSVAVMVRRPNLAT